MGAANDNTIGGGPAANDNIPRVESVPDVDEMEFDRALKGFNAMIGTIERGMIGKWYGMPPEKAPPHYVYTRAGLKGRPATLEREAVLTAFGFRRAPPGTRYGGFLMDGDNASYWYARRDLYLALKDAQQKARSDQYNRKMRAALSKPQQEFYSGEDGVRLAKHGVEVGIAGVETGSATFDEVMETERAARARLSRQRRNNT